MFAVLLAPVSSSVGLVLSNVDVVVMQVGRGGVFRRFCNRSFRVISIRGQVESSSVARSPVLGLPGSLVTRA